MSLATVSHTRIVAATLLGFIVFSPFAPATSPLPPPYHQFTVSGTIARISGALPVNITVVLFGRSGLAGDAESYVQLTSVSDDSHPDRPIAVTDSTGAFLVRASAHGPMDSLCIGIVAVDHPVILGTPFFVDPMNRGTISRTYAVAGSRDCSGCGPEPTTTELRTVGYAYSFTDYHVIIDL